MFKESGTLRKSRKHNNVLRLNTNYIVKFSFSYKLFIFGKHKKILLTNIKIN